MRIRNCRNLQKKLIIRLFICYLQVQQNNGPPVSSNQLLAWISCLCFFWPLGLVAVIKSNESDKCMGHGDIEGARRHGDVSTVALGFLIVTAKCV